MTKADLVARVSSRTNIPKKKVALALDKMLQVISGALAHHNRIELRGFGAFMVKSRKARVAHNLNTGEAIKLPPTIIPQFVPFTTLKQNVANKNKQIQYTRGPTLQTTPSSFNRLARSEPPQGTSESALAQQLAPHLEALQTDPHDQEAHYQLAEIYATHKKYDKALVHCQSVLEKNPVAVRALDQRGGIYAQQGEFERALEEYQKALRIEPDNARILNNIAIVYSQRSLYQEAENQLKKALEIDPNSPETHYNLGIVYSQRSLFAKAIQEFEGALELNPNFTEIYFHLGLAYDNQGMYDKAIEIFEKLLAIQPDNCKAYWHLGLLYDKKKMGGKALDMYQRANALAISKRSRISGLSVLLRQG